MLSSYVTHLILTTNLHQEGALIHRPIQVSRVNVKNLEAVEDLSQKVVIVLDSKHLNRVQALTILEELWEVRTRVMEAWVDLVVACKFKIVLLIQVQKTLLPAVIITVKGL